MKDLLFSFTGRANRAKFWLVLIVTDIVGMILFGIIGAIGGGSMMPDASGNMSMGGGTMGFVTAVLALIVLIAMVWIGLAVAVKRYHDRNKSGWWVLICLVPFIGGLWYLIECGFLKGTTGANTYGADPLAG